MGVVWYGVVGGPRVPTLLYIVADDFFSSDISLIRDKKVISSDIYILVLNRGKKKNSNTCGQK